MKNDHDAESARLAREAKMNEDTQTPKKCCVGFQTEKLPSGAETKQESLHDDVNFGKVIRKEDDDANGTGRGSDQLHMQTGPSGIGLWPPPAAKTDPRPKSRPRQLCAVCMKGTMSRVIEAMDEDPSILWRCNKCFAELDLLELHYR